MLGVGIATSSINSRALPLARRAARRTAARRAAYLIALFTSGSVRIVLPSLALSARNDPPCPFRTNQPSNLRWHQGQNWGVAGEACRPAPLTQPPCQREA